MKKLLFALFFVVAGVSAQTEPLTIGEKQTLHSEILNEDRLLNVYLPQGYDKAKSYPVIYLLDGSMNEDFLHVTGLVQFFNLQMKMPEAIVIGIANIDRKRDFTFHTDLPDLKKDYPTTGHSDVFLEFVEKELQPFVEKTYRVSDQKFLIGQSLGGLVACEILLKKPQLFTHYLIVSPSLWWDNESLLKKAPTLLDKEKLSGKYVFVAVGKQEHKMMQKEAAQFSKLLQEAKIKSLKVDFLSMENENHATILHRSLYEGFLKLYPFKE